MSPAYLHAGNRWHAETGFGDGVALCGVALPAGAPMTAERPAEMCPDCAQAAARAAMARDIVDDEREKATRALDLELDVTDPHDEADDEIEQVGLEIDDSDPYAEVRPWLREGR